MAEKRVEFSDRSGMSAEALRSLAKQAGMTLSELGGDIEAGGLAAAVRRAAERAKRRNHDPRRLLVELRRRRDA